MSEQGLLNALHGVQLWGIVKQSSDPSLGKGRCGSNDEFLEAYRKLENEVRCLISENKRLHRLVIALNWCTESASGPGTECENCPLGDNGSLEPTCEDMMRELGIFDRDGSVWVPEAENAKLRELAIEQMRLADAVHAYWAGGKTPEQFDALMRVTAKVNRLSNELGIEAD